MIFLLRQPRREQSRAEQSRVEQHRAEQSRAAPPKDHSSPVCASSESTPEKTKTCNSYNKQFLPQRFHSSYQDWKCPFLAAVFHHTVTVPLCWRNIFPKISSTYLGQLVGQLLPLSDLHSVSVCGPSRSVGRPWIFYLLGTNFFDPKLT